MYSANNSIFSSSKGFAKLYSSFSVPFNTSRASFTSDNSIYKGKYVKQEIYEGNTKGYNANEIIEHDQDKKEASEMGDKAKKSTDKGMDNAEHLGEEMADIAQERSHSIGEKAKQAVKGAWRAAKNSMVDDKSSSAGNVVYGEDDIVDEDHMKKLAKDPGGKPSEEDEILDVYRRPLAEKK